MYLGELVSEEVSFPPGLLEQAKLACDSNPAECAGVTCEKKGGECTMRRGFPFLALSGEGETSHVNECRPHR